MVRQSVVSPMWCIHRSFSGTSLSLSQTLHNFNMKSANIHQTVTRGSLPTFHDVYKVISFPKLAYITIAYDSSCGMCSLRGTIETMLLLTLTLNPNLPVMGRLEALPRIKCSILTVLVLVLPLLSWPRQFKTPVEKGQLGLPTESPETQLAKYLTMTNREDFDPDEMPAVYTLPQFHGLWPCTLLEIMVCACYFCTGRTYILTKWHHL